MLEPNNFNHKEAFPDIIVFNSVLGILLPRSLRLLMLSSVYAVLAK